MPILGVTGGAGYIGNVLARTAQERGWEVRAVDDLSGPISLPPRGVAFLREDFSSDASLRFLRGAAVVVHLGAVSGVVACARDPPATRRVNVDGTARLAEWCAQQHVPLAFASSLAVVGAPERMPVTEATPPAPTHEYARQKAEGERLIEQLAASGVAAAAARMSNVYGTYRTEGRVVAKGNVLNEFARQAATGVLRVNAPGSQRRDFIHIEDVVDAWLALAERLTNGPVPLPRLVFASGSSMSIREVAELVVRGWGGARADQAPPTVEVVENPRGAIELLDERFEVDPSRTWAALGIARRHELGADIAQLFS